MKNLVSACLLAAALSLGASAHADPITVPNGSFESPNTGDYTGGNQPGVHPEIMSDWSFSGTVSNSYGVQRSTTDQYYTGQVTGSQFGYINTNDSPGSITSGALTGIAYNTQYTLTVALGKRLDAPGITDQGQYTLNILDDGTVVSSIAVNGSSLTAGNLADYSVSWDSGAVGSGSLSAQIIWTHTINNGPGNFSQGSFDNVRFDAISAVPEPATWLGGALVALCLWRTKGGFGASQGRSASSRRGSAVGNRLPGPC